MLDTIFQSVFQDSAVAVGPFLLCIFSALFLGLLLALCCMYRSRCSKSFVFTLALLPAVVCVVIMMVNGNVGAGVAVAGAFSLVRFRSAPGTAREISMLFLAMGAGLIAGMGYLGYAFVFTFLLCGVTMLYTRVDLGAGKSDALYRTLSVTIPEDLDYGEVFADILEKYTADYTLVRVKTTNMGSLFRLTYDVVLEKPGCEKAMINALRCRNGNLEISLSRQETAAAEL